MDLKVNEDVDIDASDAAAELKTNLMLQSDSEDGAQGTDSPKLLDDSGTENAEQLIKEVADLLDAEPGDREQKLQIVQLLSKLAKKLENEKQKIEELMVENEELRKQCAELSNLQSNL